MVSSDLEVAIVKYLTPVLADFVPSGIKVNERDPLDFTAPEFPLGYEYVLRLYTGETDESSTVPAIVVTATVADEEIESGNAFIECNVSVVYCIDAHSGMTDPKGTMNKVTDKIFEAMRDCDIEDKINMHTDDLSVIGPTKFQENKNYEDRHFVRTLSVTLYCSQCSLAI